MSNDTDQKFEIEVETSTAAHMNWMRKKIVNELKGEDSNMVGRFYDALTKEGIQI